MPPPRDERRLLPGVLIALASVIAVFSSTTTWVRTQALDTDEWVEISSSLLDDEEIRERLALFLTDQLYLYVDVAGELKELLPEDLAELSGPLAGLLRDQATQAVDRFLASERFEDLWETANRAAHEVLVRILRDETRGVVSVADGDVVLELGVLLRDVAAAIGLPDGAVERIPDDAGRIVVFESDELARAQTTVQVLDFLSWFLFTVVVGLYAIAVAMAGDRRRTVLRNVGLALVGAGITVLLLRSLSIRFAVGALVEEAANESVATATALVSTELLRQMAWTGVLYGVLIVAFAVLLGLHPWAVALRRWLGRSSNPTGSAVGFTVAVLLVVTWWSPGRALDRWVTALTLFGLAAAAILALRSRLQLDAASVAAVEAQRGVD